VPGSARPAPSRGPSPVPGRPGVTVAVLGCGAIGSLYAAHLSRVRGLEVWVVDPWAEHMAAIGSRGLRVTGAADFTVRPHATTNPGDLPACDFGIVATKAPHTRAAVEGARAALANAAVVSVQSGLGNEEVIAELVPRVIRGSIVPAGAVTAPGTVAYEGPGDSWFGPSGRRAYRRGDGSLRKGRHRAPAPGSRARDRGHRGGIRHKPSMLQDVLAGRKTEIAVLNGGIAAEGRRAGVATPLHDCMTALVKGLEQSWGG
jgi:ketopantoate reductase